MDTNDWMNALDVLWTRVWIVAIEVLVSTNVNGLSSVDDLTELGAQLRIGSIAAGPESVASSGGNCVVVQVCNACGVLLMHEVAVPSRRSAGLSERRLSLRCLECWPNDGHTWNTWNMWDLRLVDVRR